MYVHDYENAYKLSFFEQNGLILINAQVDGTQGVFILDTGASDVIINGAVTHPTEMLNAIGEELPTQEIKISELQIGPITKLEFNGLRVDLSHIEKIIGIPVSGLVGIDIFNGHGIMIDYESMQISVVNTGADLSTDITTAYAVIMQDIVIEGNHLPMIEVTVDGKKLNAGLDSGANISVLNTNSTQSITNNLTFIPQLHIGNASVQDLPYIQSDMSEINSQRENDLDMILSLSSLNASKILIDLNKNRVFFCWKKRTS